MDAADSSFGGGQLDDLEAVPSGSGVGVAGDDLQAVFNRLVLCDRRRQRPALITDDPRDGVKSRTDDTCDLRLICDDCAAGGEAHRWQGLLNDLDLGHVVFFLDELEPPLHVDESASSDPVFLLDLSAANTQQSGDAIRINSAVKNRRDVVKTETELAQCDDTMQTLKLRGVVGAVAAELVHMSRNEQTRGVPMPQHPMGHLADLREGSDG